MKIVLVTGGFDPIHSGHIAYFTAARELGDKLYVGVNSDGWLARKKGAAFMPWAERAAIVAALHTVDRVLEFDDIDGTGSDAIEQVKLLHPNAEIIFANGGDRTQDNIPEMHNSGKLHPPGVEFVFGVGGEDKKNSSSWVLQEWKAPKTTRAWGHYRVLHEVGANTKLKELTVTPKTCLSMQRHDQRQEFWFVAEGTATVYNLDESSTDRDVKCQLDVHEHTFIECREWHQLCNETDQPLRLIEIQYGENCIESDIERQ